MGLDKSACVNRSQEVLDNGQSGSYAGGSAKGPYKIN